MTNVVVGQAAKRGPKGLARSAFLTVDNIGHPSPRLSDVWQAVFALIAWLVFFFPSNPRGVAMSIVSSTPLAAVYQITLYWRDSLHGRRLPVHLRGWRYYLRRDDYSVDDLPFPDEFTHDVDTLADAVVLLAELHGEYIDAEQVSCHWPSRSASWAKGS